MPPLPTTSTMHCQPPDSMHLSFSPVLPPSFFLCARHRPPGQYQHCCLGAAKYYNAHIFLHNSFTFAHAQPFHTPYRNCCFILVLVACCDKIWYASSIVSVSFIITIAAATVGEARVTATLHACWPCFGVHSYLSGRLHVLCVPTSNTRHGTFVVVWGSGGQLGGGGAHTLDGICLLLLLLGKAFVWLCFGHQELLPGEVRCCSK